MGQWVGECDLTPLPADSGHLWRVHAPFSYISSNGSRIDVQEGFLTDLASTPRWTWWIYPPEGLYTIPAVVHDAGYRQQLLPRDIVDEILREAMADEGCSWFTCWIFYRMVRIFGGSIWASYEKK
jgi:hypothetical protein